MPTSFGKLRFVSEFLRAQPAHLNAWVKDQPRQLAVFCFVAILFSAGAYGGAMGSWSCPLQMLYTGIKLPLAILLTTLGNGLLNGMLAPLLGLRPLTESELPKVERPLPDRLKLVSN